MPLFYWIMVYGWPPKMKDRKALKIKEDGIGHWVRAAAADLEVPKIVCGCRNLLVYSRFRETYDLYDFKY